MPESAEEIYARVVAEVGEQGHLPMPAAGEWDVFPWTVVDGQIVPRVVPPPAPERPRNGDSDHRLCATCTDRDNDRVIWENERWTVTSLPAPTGLPLVLFLQTKEHLDYPDMDDELASEYGRLSVWLCRIMSNLPNIGRVHVNRWGDGGGHLHVWFLARPARMTGILGSYAVEWDAILPPGPEDVWRADLHTVATKLAFHAGVART